MTPAGSLRESPRIEKGTPIKAIPRFAFVSLVVVSVFPLWALASGGQKPVDSPLVAETVYNLNRVKILESNTSSLRPGSIYDVATYFESLLRFPKPGFNYEFIDSGLGATEPLYPMYQKGNQASYWQLIPAFFFDSRHIDHRSSLTTPEGCKVDSAYLLRNLDEYPDTVFRKERAEGYTRVVVRLEHYTRLRPDAECGRHVAHDPDPDFDPMEFMWDNRHAMSLGDFPQEELHRFEAKLSVNFPMIEERDYAKRPRFDLRDLDRNSIWYYPDGHAFDYGLSAPRPQPELTSFRLPRHMVVEATPSLQADFPLHALLKPDEFGKVLEFLQGRPFSEFDAAAEPGSDVLRLADVTSKNVYTSGLAMEPIRDVVADVSNMENFRLVGMTMKPQEPQLDPSWAGERIVPQIRFTYQLINPRDPNHAYEQLFLHLKWDVVDRRAGEAIRAGQHRTFLRRLDSLTRAREDSAGDDGLDDFIGDFTKARPVHAVSFGSSLTGTWIFGNLERDSATRELRALRTIRQGIDYGFYSSVFDTDLLRGEIARAAGGRKEELQAVLDSLTVDTFRDPKRQDAHALRFNTVSCAQCHQMAGRDGIHMSFNDGINRKITSPTIVSEYFFHEADAQLKGDMLRWLAAK
jgi:hypothetical protein